MKPRATLSQALIAAVLLALFGTVGSNTARGGPPLQGNATPTSIPAVTANNQWKPVTQTFDGVEMVLVPPGCFQMGSTDAQIDEAFEAFKKDFSGADALRGWLEAEAPIHQVCFEEAFWIDKYEVTNIQFNRLGGQAAIPSKWTDDNRPREQIIQSEAGLFCAKRGSRLPTEAEWEYVARGPDGLIFPWGNTFVAENAVNLSSETANVGSKPGGVSWVGAYDLSGNVSEWVSDWHDEKYYASSPKVNPQGPSGGQFQVLRGGSWSDFNTFVRAAARIKSLPALDRGGDTNGFRCARSLN